jgi:hypothetical protein
MYTTIIRDIDLSLGDSDASGGIMAFFLWSGSDDACVKKDDISPVVSQPPSVIFMSLMMVVYMPPKHVGVKVAH